MGVAIASEAPFEILEENKMITELKKEKDPSRRDALVRSLSNKCPFKEDSSEVGALITSSINLNNTVNVSDAKKVECQGYVDNINASLANTKKMQGLLADTNEKIDDVAKAKLEEDLKTTLAGTSGLHSLLASQCSVSSNSSVVSGSNQIIGAVENGSTALAFVNPVAALIGAGAAAAGRLVVGLGDWVFNRPKKDAGDEVKDSERFVNDLCAFRDLTYKYDKLATDPFKKDPVTEEKKKGDPERVKKLLTKKVDLEIELAESNDLLICTQQMRSSVDSLQAFSKDLAPFIEKPASQRECLNILNKYIDTKSTNKPSPLDTLATRYGCLSSEDSELEVENKRYMSFCKNYSAIEKMVEGDLYEKCENEDFQKQANLKFTSLSDLILRSIEDDAKSLVPAETKIKDLQAASKNATDELQRAREGDQASKLTQEKYNGLKSAMDINPITNTNTAKAMTFVGRNLLGERFDTFAEKSLESAGKDIEEASDVLKDLVKQKDKIEGRKFFSFKKYSGAEKAQAQKELCSSVYQVKRQFINGYRSNAGIKDICDFTKGDGIPPLKSLGVNFDSYSATSSNREYNMTSRCKEIDVQVAKNNDEIRKQLTAMSGLGCEN
jgi:hypothetical protein